MKLKLGKQYKTRNGMTTPPLQTSKGGTGYIFSAAVREPEHPDASVCAWLPTGEFLTSVIEHRLDLVEEANP